jgi:hypothetical protein
LSFDDGLECAPDPVATCGTGLEALGDVAVFGFAPVLSGSGLPLFGSFASVLRGLRSVLSGSVLPVFVGFASVFRGFAPVFSGLTGVSLLSVVSLLPVVSFLSRALGAVEVGLPAHRSVLVPACR